MRRSKSDPAKYARNYRKISQRRMTKYDHLDEDEEIEKLRSILKTSQDHLKNAAIDEEENDNDDVKTQSSNQKRKRKEQEEAVEDPVNSILSEELQAESLQYGAENPLIVIPSKKKKAPKKPKIQLTPEEIKQAKALQKKTARKLEQLEKRANQKKKRAQIYETLEKNKVSSQVASLLSSSGSLSRRNTATKKQTLQKLLNKERQGIKLTQEEHELLYPNRPPPVDEQSEQEANPKLEGANNSEGKAEEPKKKKKKKKAKGKEKSQVDDDRFATTDSGPESSSTTVINPILQEPTTNDPKQRRKFSAKEVAMHVQDKSSLNVDKQDPGESGSTVDGGGEDMDTGNDSDNNEPDPEVPTKAEQKGPTFSGANFAAQMMASVTKLKSDSDKKSQELAAKRMEEKQEELPLPSHPVYVPKEETVLKTAASLGIKAKDVLSSRKVLSIKRPEEIEKMRYDLPVSGMEFELMDAVRNNDVTIICSETGSGKSTQVPQFLYESGFTVNSNDKEKPFLIGITQPRRVAAVSTAKRVCYEVGEGNGQSIQSKANKGNLVSYQTRYETAGIGSSNRIKFMTDGILLQEIQSDLLLRKYSVVVLDEAHERNLNTDVLIGLLSVALPLRRKAAEEDSSIVPLKLVLMSATLRVKDFTENHKLFPSGPPAVVTVPGRTFPVTIHHSKVTELDRYEDVAFKKICKMHRKLPHGGILVFLTGKQEIIRMVNRLRRALKSKAANKTFTDANDVSQSQSTNESSSLREMDDEEIDGDGLAMVDDFDDMESEEKEGFGDEPVASDGSIPTDAYILPLYSMLSAEEQAKVFAPVPENSRLIVLATNIAETSITIPGVSYVVDTGRQKQRNYNSGTGVASYDIMWISKAAADQRAGRAGRTGPGHCYRLYSSSLYARHMDDFALPEVLTRPLEDVVLAMKAMKVSDVGSFPFPTPPDRSQIAAAVKLLANIGCVDTSAVELDGGDGLITKLGSAVAKLPLGVRYGKMLLVAANAGVLDYAIVMVAVLSERSPFEFSVQQDENETEKSDDDDDESMDEIDKRRVEELESKKKKTKRWTHRSGDVLAAVLAVGGYTYAGRGAGGASEVAVCKKFCQENGLNYVVMTRIQKMRSHLAHLAKIRLGSAEGFAAKTGGFLSSMSPPNTLQENLLVQAIASGLIDNIALLAPPGSISGDHPFSLRTAYLSSSNSLKEPLYIDRNSVVFSRDSRQLPQWICFDSIIRKTAKDGTPVSTMKNITPINPAWIGAVARGSRMLSLEEPLASPPPSYDKETDTVMCHVVTKFGSHGWEVPSVQCPMYETLNAGDRKHEEFMKDDSFRWFARYLLEGKVIDGLEGLVNLLSDSPTLITRKTPIKKVSVLVSQLASAGVDSAAALRKHWAEKDNKFLFGCLKDWVKRDMKEEAKQIWIQAVKDNSKIWQKQASK